MVCVFLKIETGWEKQSIKETLRNLQRIEEPQYVEGSLRRSAAGVRATESWRPVWTACSDLSLDGFERNCAILHIWISNSIRQTHVSFCAMQWQHWVCYPTRVLREGLIFTKRSNRRLVSGMLSQVFTARFSRCESCWLKMT